MNYSQNKNILVEKYKSIFFILPKNGCSSVKAKLIEVLEFPKGSNYPTDVHDPKTYPYPFVMLSELHNYESDYLIFCIVRNPWDRLVSCFKDKIRPQDYNSDEFVNGVALPLLKNSSLFYGGMSFSEFVDVVCSIPDAIAEHHFTSQLYQMTDDAGNLLVNYIGRLETMEEDLKIISNKSGLPHSQIPHLHKTKRKSYQEYYTYDMIEKVRNRYSADIEFFDYQFDQNSNLPKIGFVTDYLRNRLSNSNLIIPILKEKIHSLQNANSKTTEQIKIEKRKISEVKDSISWKITAPLRWLRKSN